MNNHIRAMAAVNVNQPKKKMSTYYTSSDLGNLQMGSKMFIDKQVLKAQVDILNNDKIPSQLKASDQYIYRHIGNSEHSIKKILEELKVSSVDDLMN